MGLQHENILNDIYKVIEEYDDFLDLLYQNRLELYNDFNDFSIHGALVFNLLFLIKLSEEVKTAQMDFFNFYMRRDMQAHEVYSAILSNKRLTVNLKRIYFHQFKITDKTTSLENFWLRMQYYSLQYTKKNVFDTIIGPYCMILNNIFEDVYDCQNYILELPASILEYMNSCIGTAGKENNNESTSGIK